MSLLQSGVFTIYIKTISISINKYHGCTKIINILGKHQGDDPQKAKDYGFINNGKINGTIYEDIFGCAKEENIVNYGDLYGDLIQTVHGCKTGPMSG